MGIPEKSALAVLAVVVTSVVTCALFVCREGRDLCDSLHPQVPKLEQAPPAVVPETLEVDAEPGLTRARPGPDEEIAEPPDTQRWYRRRGLAPNWTMRTREPLLGRGGARVRREPLPELKVDLVEPPVVEDDPAPPADPAVR